MRRFDYDENEEYREDVDKFFEADNEISPGQFNSIIREENEIQELQLEFVNRDLNYRILRSAIKMCEKTFFWSFRSHISRLNMIKETYNRFRELEISVLPTQEIEKIEEKSKE